MCPSNNISQSQLILLTPRRATPDFLLITVTGAVSVPTNYTQQAATPGNATRRRLQALPPSVGSETTYYSTCAAHAPGTWASQSGSACASPGTLVFDNYTRAIAWSDRPHRFARPLTLKKSCKSCKLGPKPALCRVFRLILGASTGVSTVWLRPHCQHSPF